MTEQTMIKHFNLSKTFSKNKTSSKLALCKIHYSS